MALFEVEKVGLREIGEHRGGWRGGEFVDVVEAQLMLKARGRKIIKRDDGFSGSRSRLTGHFSGVKNGF